MNTMFRFAVFFAFAASAVPAFALGHGNDGAENEISPSAPYTHRLVSSPAPASAPGYGNEGGGLEPSRAGTVVRIAGTTKAPEAIAMESRARFVDRSADAGG